MELLETAVSSKKELYMYICSWAAFHVSELNPKVSIKVAVGRPISP